MADRPLPSRAALTATTLLALVAMSATAASPAPRAQEGTPAGESRLVRVVAAAVAAAARDFLGAEHCTAALTLRDADTDPVRPRGANPPATRSDVTAVMRLGVRLLDLPPPAC